MASISRLPMRLSAAEQTLVEQLSQSGHAAEAERLAATGLPTRRVEAYHYTDLKQLLRSVPPVAAPGGPGERSGFSVAGAVEFPIVNGTVYAEETLPPGIAAKSAPGSSLSAREDILVGLNTALARQSLVLTLEAGSPLVHIDRRGTGEAAHIPSAARIAVAAGAEAVVVETYSASGAGHLSNDSTVVSLGAGASLTHVTLDLSPGESTHFASIEYELAEGARLRSLIIHAGAGLARTQVFARFSGRLAHADFGGLNLVDDGQHRDITLDVNHAVPDTTSQEMFKQVARGRSRAVFQGRIVVARDAQKTDAKMMMQGLMLSDEAEILSKPELEIYADDVQCAHGATCAALEEEYLFYLMARGIPRKHAEAMLIEGFVGEVLEAVEDEALRAELTAVTAEWLVARD